METLDCSTTVVADQRRKLWPRWAPESPLPRSSAHTTSLFIGGSRQAQLDPTTSHSVSSRTAPRSEGTAVCGHAASRFSARSSATRTFAVGPGKAQPSTIPNCAHELGGSLVRGPVGLGRRRIPNSESLLVARNRRMAASCFRSRKGDRFHSRNQLVLLLSICHRFVTSRETFFTLVPTPFARWDRPQVPDRGRVRRRSLPLVERCLRLGDDWVFGSF